MDKVWRWDCPIRVQAKTAEEAKARIESRLKAWLLHPEGIDAEQILEVIENGQG